MALSERRRCGQRVAIMTRGPDQIFDRPGTIHLAVSQRGKFLVASSIAAIEDLKWLGEPVEPSSEAGPWRRVNSVLALPVMDGSSPGPIHKGALVDVGPVERSPDSIRVAISWQSDSVAPLFPVFAGRLTIRTNVLSLEGEYAPPLGRIGLLLDQRILNFVARRTAQAFLARFADRLEDGPVSS
jgi:hypothetical protein